jgi:hypothetical protein
VAALERLLLQPNSAIYQTAFAEGDERGESLYEDLLASAQKLTEAKGLLRIGGK